MCGLTVFFISRALLPAFLLAPTAGGANLTIVNSHLVNIQHRNPRDNVLWGAADNHMSNVIRGLPLTSSRTEQVFPTLTPAQIRRIAAQGHVRSTQPGEVLVQQGDSEGTWAPSCAIKGTTRETLTATGTRWEAQISR